MSWTDIFYSDPAVLTLTTIIIWRWLGFKIAVLWILYDIAAGWEISNNGRSRAAWYLSWKAINDRYGDDQFGQNPGWADGLEDLGENAEPLNCSGPSEGQ